MSIIEAAVGILSPPECLNCGIEGTALCKNCAKLLIKPFGERCWRCSKLSPGSRTCQSCRPTGSPSRVWIVTDYDAVAKELVTAYKFGHLRAAADSIAGMMAKIVVEIPADVLITPVPTATSRIRERGFDHAALLAKTVAAELKLEHREVLRRLGQIRQLGSKREDRLRQLSASFAVRRPGQIIGRHILLIDDVVTTGGTLIAAAKTLRAAGAKQVDALLFAKRL